MLVSREIGDVVSRLVAAVENTVEDDDLLNAVQRAFVGEAVPSGFRDDAFATERVEVELDSIVRWRKDGVVSASRQQLLHRGLCVRTDWHTAEQAHVLAVVVKPRQIFRNGLVREDVSRRRINLLCAAHHSKQQGGCHQ